eukprot:scaffold18450_cov68-Phaeocystis_antarctica.AAC.10
MPCLVSWPAACRNQCHTSSATPVIDSSALGAIPCTRSNSANQTSERTQSHSAIEAKPRHWRAHPTPQSSIGWHRHPAAVCGVGACRWCVRRCTVAGSAST